MQKARPNPLIMAVAMAFLVTPAWSIYQLLTDYGHAPQWIGIFGAAGIDATIVLMGRQALTNSEDGDASWPWNLGMIFFAGLSIAAQISHSIIANEPVAVGGVMSALAIAGVVLIEGQLRRCHRINGRRANRLPMARSRVSTEQWWHFREESRYATKIAVAFPDLDTASIFAAGKAYADQQEIVAPQRARRSLGLGIAITGLPAIESGQAPNTSGQSPDANPDHTLEKPHDHLPAGTVSAQVRAVMDGGETDNAVIAAEVLRINPNANPETVRATIRREQKQRRNSA